MLNFVDCKIITIFEVDKAIKGNVVRGRNTRNSEDDSVARRVVVYASTFPHCSMKSSEYLWPKTKRLVKDERRSKSKLRVCA